MRRIHLFTVVGVILIALIFAYSQSPQSTSQSPGTTNAGAQTGTNAGATTTTNAQPVKAKKMLVSELPKGLEGIVLKDGVFKLSPGFKFVPRTGSTLALVRNEGGGNGSANVDCSCSGKEGACVPKTTSGGGTTVLTCVSASKENACTGECIMAVTMGGSKTKLAIF